MKRFALVCAAALLFGFVGLAGAAVDAQTVVQETTTAVIDRVKAEKDTLRGDPAKMYSLVSDTIFPHFDFSIMSQWVLGEHWKIADTAQRQEFVEQFRRLLVRTYATALLEYSDQTIAYPANEASHNPKTATVKQDIKQPGGTILPVVYRLHNKSGDWKVFDVAVDGVSLVKTYKSSFAQVIAEGGIAKLIANLKDKNKDLGL
ncbi:MAG: ABC transporter substrate-binding protein [Gammaproteobacteria bacterium]|nr:ABC transporter substrate-binding protein [Gammaproteobacteria bacterium]